MNPLERLRELGQSVWYDQMTRSLLTDGKLQNMIDRDRLGGLTSNPTIFEKAIGGSGEYDSELKELSGGGASVDEIYERIVMDDIGGAADVFRPVYDSSDGEHGFVSLEVDPRLAHDTEGTIEQGIRFHRELGRPNVMIKVPATPDGIPAIRKLISEGVPVNVTLIFSRDVYDHVIEAYLGGLEDRAASGLDLFVPSVASFFVSRIDSAVDELLEQSDAPEARELRGRIAIANAKLAYQLFLERFGGERFEELRKKGAVVQRPLWASTSTKNPDYPDVLYVDALAGPDSVNTLPPATYEAYRDHGDPESRIEKDVDEAREQLQTLERIGISLENVTDELTRAGVESFENSFVSLMQTIEKQTQSAA